MKWPDSVVSRISRKGGPNLLISFDSCSVKSLWIRSQILTFCLTNVEARNCLKPIESLLSERLVHNPYGSHLMSHVPRWSAFDRFPQSWQCALTFPDFQSPRNLSFNLTIAETSNKDPLSTIEAEGNRGNKISFAVDQTDLQANDSGLQIFKTLNLNTSKGCNFDEKSARDQKSVHSLSQTSQNRHWFFNSRTPESDHAESFRTIRSNPSREGNCNLPIKCDWSLLRNYVNMRKS
jgi:hypothetical protein